MIPADPGPVPRRTSRSPLVRSADGLPTFLGLLSLQGVLFDANAMTPDGFDRLGAGAFGSAFCDASWWSWSPLVQQRLAAAVERAGAGDLVRYNETMRMHGNRLVTVDITLLLLRTSGGVSTIACSIVDASEGLRADRQVADHR